MALGRGKRKDEEERKKMLHVVTEDRKSCSKHNTMKAGSPSRFKKNISQKPSTELSRNPHQVKSGKSFAAFFIDLSSM
jgi:hypothetical protein